MRAVIYTRVSTDEQVKEGYSLDNQRFRLVEYCKIKDWDVIDIYSDEGLSGFSIKKRPQLQKMLTAAKNKDYDIILVLKIDRLNRNTKEFLEILDTLEKCNVRLFLLEENIDYSTPTGKLMTTILASFAEHERNTISSRMMSGKEQKVREGIFVRGPHVIFGYKWNDELKILEQVPSEVEALHGAYKMICETSSLYKTAKYLDRYTTTRKWTHKQVRQVLLSPTLAGYTHMKRKNDGRKIISNSVRKFPNVYKYQIQYLLMKSIIL